MADIRLPDFVLQDLFDVLSGILEACQSITNSTQEFRLVQTQIIRTVYEVLITDTTKVELLEVDKDFCESLDIPKLLKSKSEAERDLVINFSLLLLNIDKDVTMSDLVGYDQDSRDIITKKENIKLWEAVNDMSRKYNKLGKDVD